METIGRKTYKSVETIHSQPVASIEEYIASYNSKVQLAESAEGWNDYPIDFEHSSDTVLRLIAGGNTAWHLPFFYSDIMLALRSLRLGGRLFLDNRQVDRRISKRNFTPR